jgi:hypothetical protein
MTERSDSGVVLQGPSTTPLTCAWCGTSHRSIVELLDHVDCCHLPDESSAAATLTRRLAAASARWWWVPYVGVVVPLFLLVGGTIAIANEDEPQRTDVVGFSGTVVQAIGLVVALIAGLQVLRQMSSRPD